MQGDGGNERQSLIERIRELEGQVVQLRARLAIAGVGEVSPATVDKLLVHRALLEQLPDIVAVLDRQHTIIYLNRGLPGFPPAEMLGKNALERVPEDQRPTYCAVFERAWETGEPQYVAFESILQRSYETRFVPVKEGERCVLMLATSVDVTDRKRADAALRESESRLRIALEASHMGTWSWDARSGTLFWDEVLCEIVGVRPETAPKDYAQYVVYLHPEDRARVEAHIARAMQTGVYETFEHRVVRPTGEVRHFFCTGAVITDDAGRSVGLRGGVLDVTDRKRLEERLLQAQKMDAVGQLTAGVAHNFNNLLSVILPNIALVQADPQLTPRMAARLADAEYAAERAAELVRQLVVFARADTGKAKEILDPVQLARRTFEMCRMTFRQEIALVLEADEDVASVQGNAAQLEQVILNICLNARDALSEARTEHPRICVRVKNASGGSVSISVEDNGPGLDEATRRRMFEPFFTTKPVGRGTGLGLASAYAIVQEHWGSIHCVSTPGQGTVLRIELPATQRASTPRAQSLAPKAVEGNELVLLVDDEPHVRRALQAVLMGAGYRVLEAGDGSEALQTLERHQAEIKAVILDRSMPRMSGDALIEEMRMRGIQTPTLAISGYPARQDDTLGADAQLTKPVPTPQLLSALRKLLDAPDRR